MLQPGAATLGPKSTNGVRPDESVWLIEGVLNANFFDARRSSICRVRFTDGATILPVDCGFRNSISWKNPKAEIWLEGRRDCETSELSPAPNQFSRRRVLPSAANQAWDARNYFKHCRPGRIVRA